MGDLDIIIRECKSAQTENREITDDVARMIGALYHDGQASISYSFASTGAISDRTDVYRECFPDYSALPDAERIRIIADMFGTYLSNRAGLDRVPGWSDLWVHA